MQIARTTRDDDTKHAVSHRGVEARSGEREHRFVQSMELQQRRKFEIDILLKIQVATGTVRNFKALLYHGIAQRRVHTRFVDRNPVQVTPDERMR